VEREVMSESLIQPRKQLALDTDWGSAVVAVWAFFLCALFGTVTGVFTLKNRFHVSSVHWWTPLFAAWVIYIGLSFPERLLKISAFVFSIGPISRIILWLVRASSETRLTNEIFVRWIDTALYFAGCIYVVWWFKSKVRYV
jgi:hypothetical protein